jgi:hypothetical protein
LFECRLNPGLLHHELSEHLLSAWRRWATGEVSLFQTLTPRSAPRRANLDAQHRLWLREYRGDRIVFDLKASHFKEWKLNTRWSAPYDVAR